MPLLYYILTASYCTMIFALSSSPDLGTVELPFNGADKLIHMTLYGGLAAIVSVGIRRSRKPATPWTQVFAPILFAFFYGFTDEIHQLYVPDRSFDFADMVADMAGATTIQAILCWFWLRYPRAQNETRQRELK
ncbi:MAG: VanZ family protein [Candidatus Hydrogenedentes bacterium]|nr:VanZ family protein [Candidatus Hydrogenedentota bacterium]